jgi:hypothetical protein
MTYHKYFPHEIYPLEQPSSPGDTHIKFALWNNEMLAFVALDLENANEVVLAIATHLELTDEAEISAMSEIIKTQMPAVLTVGVPFFGAKEFGRCVADAKNSPLRTLYMENGLKTEDMIFNCGAYKGAKHDPSWMATYYEAMYINVMREVALLRHRVQNMEQDRDDLLRRLAGAIDIYLANSVRDQHQHEQREHNET